MRPRRRREHGAGQRQVENEGSKLPVVEKRTKGLGGRKGVGQCSLLRGWRVCS